LSVNGKRNGIERSDLLEVARKMNIKGAKDLIEEVDQSVGRWKEFADEQSVDPALRDAIARTFVRMNPA
jgi:serine/threonine-protein kinase HipA